MPIMVPRKPYERLLIRKKWLLYSRLISSDETSIKQPPAVEVQLSPSKATRAAMLKTRFAETIFKAKQGNLFEYDQKTKLLVKATIAGVENENGKNIARQRVKARRDLEKMKATDCFEDNVKTMEELRKLAGCCVSYGFNGEYSLDKIGLRLKDSGSRYDDIEDSILNEGIEGEIVD